MILKRSVGLWLSLFLATGAAAQLVGPEVLSSPFTPQTASDGATAASIARLGQSAVIAWPVLDSTGVGQILLARLDGRLNAIASHEVQTLTPGANASWPSIATDGNNIVVVWSEVKFTKPIGVMAALFDHDLTLLAGPRLLMAGDYRGHATSAGDTLLVVANDKLFRFKSDSFASPEVLPLPVSAIDSVGFNGTYGPTFAGIESRPIYGACPSNCVIGGGGGIQICGCASPVIAYSSAVHLAVLYRDPLTWQSPSQILFRAMASGAIDTLMIWRVDDVASTGTLQATVIPGLAGLQLPQPLHLDMMQAGEPGVTSVAWDGERYAVVWQSLTSGPYLPPNTNHAIRFATIENGAIALQAVLVDSPADDVRPFILATAPGQYILGYEVITGGEHRLAGRVVSLNPSGRKRPAG